MQKVSFDTFWDGKTGGGVRCSSIGEDATKYHDAANHVLEKSGRSVASLLPKGRGTIIPRATTFGGSRGFDPHKPRLINIDPYIKGQSCVVDLSQITPATMKKAIAEAAQNPLAQDDLQLMASQTFHNLAVSYEPIGMKSSNQKLESRPHPFGGIGYVTPKASLGGGQTADVSQITESAIPPYGYELMSPSVSPKSPPKQKQASQEQLEKQMSKLQLGTMLPIKDERTLKDLQSPEVKAALKPRIVEETEAHTISAPTAKVTFEMKGWGTFEASYHEIIRNDVLLVLCYDLNYKNGLKFFPPTTSELMAVKLGNSIYFVHSLGTKFIHGNYEYGILIIEQGTEDATGS